MSQTKMTVNQISVPNQQTIGDTVFPLVWKCEAQTLRLTIRSLGSASTESNLMNKPPRTELCYFVVFRLPSPKTLTGSLRLLSLRIFRMSNRSAMPYE